VGKKLPSFEGLARLKAMNWKSAVRALIYGVAMVFLLFRALLPGSSVTYFPLQDEVGSSIEASQENYRIFVERTDEEILKVEVERKISSGHYLMGLAFGLLFGLSHYQTLRKNAAERNEKEFQEPAPDIEPADDPLYERFLAEDESRRLVPAAVLKKDFAEWKRKNKKV